MAENTFSAAANPDLANDLIQKAVVETKEPVQPAEIIAPFDNLVTLPGGYVNAAGEVIKTVEVRELTGRDEEAISKSNSLGRTLLTIINRATVKIGDEPANEQLLDKMFSGDRDAVLLGIYKATFGNTCEIDVVCQSCEDYRTVAIDVNDDIPVAPLADVLTESSFTVQGKKNEFLVHLPDGTAQKEIYLNMDKTQAELTSILLEKTILEINGNPILGKSQIQNLGLADRKAVIDALAERNFGPQFDVIQVNCPECGEELEVPLSLGALFRF